MAGPSGSTERNSNLVPQFPLIVPSYVSLPIKLSSPTTRDFWEIPVLFEDDDLLVIDKPAAVAISPDPNHSDRPCLSALIHAGISDGKPWATSRNLSFLAAAHQLDSESSGVLLFAKSEPMREQLANLFATGQPLVEYVTLVRDAPKDGLFEVSAKIAADPKKPGYMKIDPQDGRKASTQFEAVEKFRAWTLLRCRPLTQEPHQIRIHLSEIRHPIAGDFKYGGKPLWLSSFKQDYRLKPGKKERPLISSPILHAEKLTIPHPKTGTEIVVESPWPRDLKTAVKFLRLHAAE
jgi:RluA family pseudouridine synthase